MNKKEAKKDSVERPQAINVLLIALGCGLALATINWGTADRIRRNESAALRADLQTLLVDTSALPGLLPELSEHPASWQLCNGRLLAHSAAAGYAGPIRLLYTLDPDNPTGNRPRLIRVAVESHQETPGITDFLRQPEHWLAQFEGQHAPTSATVDAVSGATISSRAITDHLRSVLRDPQVALGSPIAMDCQP